MQFVPFMILALAAIWIWNSAPGLVVLLVVGVIVLLAYLAMRAREDREKAEANAIALQSAAINTIQRHRSTLARKARQAIYKDDYGQFVFDKWLREREYFISNVLAREHPGVLEQADLKLLEDTITAVALDTSAITDSADRPLPEGMTPREFEHYCAAVLAESGWDARVTPEGPDQGVDIVAESNGCKAVIQCKLYSKPVGNAAVQEVVAGRAFEQAEVAVVVSNAPFTASARQLAATTNVHLLHISELPELLEIVLPSSAAPSA